MITMNATPWELNIFASQFHELEKAVTKRPLRSVFTLAGGSKRELRNISQGT